MAARYNNGNGTVEYLFSTLLKQRYTSHLDLWTLVVFMQPGFVHVSFTKQNFLLPGCSMLTFMQNRKTTSERSSCEETSCVIFPLLSMVSLRLLILAIIYTSRKRNPLLHYRTFSCIKICLTLNYEISICLKKME